MGAVYDWLEERFELQLIGDDLLSKLIPIDELVKPMVCSLGFRHYCCCSKYCFWRQLALLGF